MRITIAKSKFHGLLEVWPADANSLDWLVRTIRFEGWQLKARESIAVDGRALIDIAMRAHEDGVAVKSIGRL